ncbi:hypothetical protein [Roseibium sediminicola]|uniref:Phosphoribulokinase/uridine kinase domain-containing protein n=1 Tax=Roseibium sediminicola TaxID=2933272 RepID=A0ABT0H2S6_9HYPH|nr:hypothetical protein [Roseibium sp. CAU 1639]MCK7615926.1 hypothetical protein [Roseibium sp. CAU 1639]
MNDRINFVDQGQVIDFMASLMRRPDVCVVGVSGFAGAGKTTLCETTVSAYPEQVVRLNCDLFSAFSIQERRERIDNAFASGNPEVIEAEMNPRNWYDWKGIHHAIDGLRQRRAFETNKAWNHTTGLLDAHYSKALPPAGPVVVLCDCIFLLHEPVRTWLEHSLLVQSSHDAIAVRRSNRAKDKEAERQARERQERFEVPYFERHSEYADIVFQDSSLVCPDAGKRASSDLAAVRHSYAGSG